MSIIDTDKGNLDRSNPSLNHDGKMPAETIKAHGTISTTYKTDASISNLKLIMKNSLIATYDTNNNITSFYGYVPGASTTVPVLIMAKAGYDVFTDILGISRPVGF